MRRVSWWRKVETGWKQRERAAGLAGLLLLAGGASPGAAAQPAARPPNIVLILVDDLGAVDLSGYGSRYIETPHLDALARQGMKFTQAYAACAVCSPTRAAILTGRYPARLGITDWIHYGARERQAEQLGRHLEGYVHARGRALDTPINGAFLPHAEVTLAELLQPLGYRTCHIGKWHLGGTRWLPESQGFEQNIGGTRYGAPGSYYDPFPKQDTYPRTAIKARKSGEYLTDREGEEAEAFIRAHRDEPFFLYMAHYAVHAPIQPRKDLLKKYQEKPITTKQRCPEYATMVESVDQAVGRILAVLDELKLADQTLVIFTSDNGGASHVRCHGVPATDNSPFRRGKGFPYEGGIREPLIVRWPGHVPAGTVEDTPVCSIDLLPTIAAVTGAKPPTDRVIDGVSLWPLLTRTGKLARTTLYWHFPHYWWGTNVRPYSIIRDGDWKLIHFYETGRDELYHLATDLGEQHDLAAREPERAARLRRKLEAWLDAVHAKRPRPAAETRR